MTSAVKVPPTPAPVHVVPHGSGMHRADRNCPCGVRSMADLLMPSRAVFVHRRPVESKPLKGEHLEATRTSRTTPEGGPAPVPDGTPDTRPANRPYQHWIEPDEDEHRVALRRVLDDRNER